METYNRYLKIIEKEFGHENTTDNQELDRYCTAVFGNSKYKGAVALDRIPRLKSGQCCIFNLDKHSQSGSHWMGLYKDGKRHVVYDSFGRKSQILGIPLKNYIDTQNDAEQRKSETNCGQRVIAFLACCYTLPIEQVLTI